MIMKTVNYKDFNGEERTEKFYFHLGKVELAKLDVSKKGGIKKYIEKIVEENDVEKIVELFIEVIDKAYGVKSEDGKRFIKSQELTEAFIQSAAYDQLVVSVMSEENAAQAFIKGVVNA